MTCIYCKQEEEMSEKVKIGEREFVAPLRYKHCVSTIVDDLNEPLFYVSGASFDVAEQLGHRIADALNFYAKFKKNAKKVTHREFEINYLGGDTREEV